MNGALRTLGRLLDFARGGVRLALGGARGDDARAAVLSSDVFATLIARTSDEQAAWRAGALTFARLIREAGLELPGDVFDLRRRGEAALSAARRAAGQDPDFTHAELYTHLAQQLGVTDAHGLASAVAAAEAGWERRLTRPVAALHRWYLGALDAKRRIIAISDTRYSGAELGEILAAHGYERLARIYCSADHRANKFSGRLLGIVARDEAVAPCAISHRGDSLLSDVLMPARHGFGVARVSLLPAPAAAAPLPVCALVDPETVDPPRAMGFEVLGPVFAAFARLLLAQAYGEGMTHLAFVARDGELPMQVALILAEALPAQWRPRISYVYLSRRALEDVLDSQGRPNMRGERVLRYLAGAGVLDARTAIVDIGWRGSIHDAVLQLAGAAGASAPRAYYLARWNEDRLPADHHAMGILGDQRRRRGPREGAAWFAALLLEGVARAGHGTTIDYVDRSDGTVAPVLAEAGVMREAEVGTQAVQRAIRQGVLDHARALAKLDGIAAPPHARRTRAAAQAILFRLAFFPDARSRAVGRLLIHSESGDGFFARLVQAPGKGLLGRLRTLRSPWKGAGFFEVGGWLGAWSYLLTETAFCYLPLGLKTRLRSAIGAPPNDAPGVASEV